MVRTYLAAFLAMSLGLTASAADPVIALLKTTKGDIKLELNMEKAPITVENFVKYANDGDYNGTIFHRVIDGFMVQGGGFTEDMVKKENRDPIKNESDNGLTHDKYTIAMARLGGDADSASNQFFINVQDNNSSLRKGGPGDGFGYAVFGKVIEGEDVVDAIKVVATTRVKGYSDVPVEPIVIESVEIVK